MSLIPEESRIDPRTKRELFPAGTRWSQVIAKALVRMAAGGNLKAIKELREATEGRSPLRIQAVRDLFEEEGLTDPDSMEAAVRKLGVVDQQLLIAATGKIIEMADVEANRGAAPEGLATDGGGAEQPPQSGTSGTAGQAES